jgi:hypothetical protein
MGKQRYVDPTPEEIQERAAMIRAEWCDEVRRQREVMPQRTEWRPRTYSRPATNKVTDFNY